MLERGGQSRLALEALTEVVVVCEVGRQQLQGPALPKPDVLRQVDHAHASATEQALDGVPRELVADLWHGYAHTLPPQLVLSGP